MQGHVEDFLLRKIDFHLLCCALFDPRTKFGHDRDIDRAIQRTVTIGSQDCRATADNVPGFD